MEVHVLHTRFAKTFKNYQRLEQCTASCDVSAVFKMAYLRGVLVCLSLPESTDYFAHLFVYLY
jgi:hypothetical protein